jgi:hypothetical protein
MFYYVPQEDFQDSNSASFPTGLLEVSNDTGNLMCRIVTLRGGYSGHPQGDQSNHESEYEPYAHR